MTPSPAAIGRWRPFTPQGLVRTVFAGTAAALVVLSLYGVIQGAGAGYWVALVGAAAIFLSGLEALRRNASQAPTAVYYLVPLGGAGALTAFLLAAGLEPERFAIAYALLAVVSASMFPRTGQIAIHVVTVAAFEVALLSTGHPLDATLLPAGLYLVVAYLAAIFARDLQDAIGREATATSEVRRREQLLRTTADIHDLDIEQAAQAAVQAMHRLGFDIATLAVVIADGLEMVPLASVGLEEEIGSEPIPVGKGLAGRAVEAGRTLDVADYHAFDGRLPGRAAVHSGIAVPIAVDGEWVAVLQGGRRTTGEVPPAEREVIEVIAHQVGRAIENARRFEAEQRAVEHQRRLDALKNDFVSNVSHELRTPLTVIEGLGHTVARRVDSLDSDQRRDLLARIVGNATRLGEMINAMLDFSRFEADGVRPDLATVDLGELAELAATRLASLLDDRPFEVEVEPAPVHGDASLLEHVIENLLGNAAKHTPRGTPVWLRVWVEGEQARLVVEDAGPGIPEDELPHVTERFYRGAVYSRRPSPGMGLGLALVQQILLGHESRLEVSNREEGGARFGFRLPLARDQAAGSAIS